MLDYTAADRLLTLMAGTSLIEVPKKQVPSLTDANPTASVSFYMELAYDSTLRCLYILLNSSWFLRLGVYFYYGLHTHIDFLQNLHMMPPTILLKSYPLNLIDGLPDIMIPIYFAISIVY